MKYLLDVNVLIALCDAGHTGHSVAVAWLRQHCRDGWGTCPITENAVVRIMSQPAYPNHRPAGVVVDLLRRLKRYPGQVFCPDNLSLSDQAIAINWKSVTAKRLTDVYLLALAVRLGAQLVTFDARIDASIVAGGSQSLVVLPVQA